MKITMPRKVMLVHNRYIRAGGEDTVYETEKKILKDHGHEVLEFQDDNHRAADIGWRQLAGNLLWSQSRLPEFADVLDRWRPDVVHVHNLYYMIGPGIYYACRRRRIPVVQTLHNFRLGCINGRFSDQGTPCERCSQIKLRWPGVVKHCFQQSFSKSAALTAAIDLHRLLGTWRNRVDLYIALTDFARAKHICNGVPAVKLMVKPNCVPFDPGMGSGNENYCLFVGRLERDKGIETLLESAARLPRGVELVIVGDGPLAGRVQTAAQTAGNIRWVGQQPQHEVLGLMKHAKLLIFPSLAYENFGVVVVEAYATGLPVIGSRLGAIQELVKEDVTGALFPAGDAAALAQTASRLLADPPLLDRLRAAARREYELKYTPDACYRSLMNIYDLAEQNARRETHGLAA
jgi:glycosyltransferase involved in cell wall biosynthesis